MPARTLRSVQLNAKSPHVPDHARVEVSRDGGLATPVGRCMVADRIERWLSADRGGSDKEDRRVMHMMDGSCGVVMAVIAGLGGLLGLGLVGSLIVLIWVVIGRLRRVAVSG